jgi:hypothetical protein
VIKNVCVYASSSRYLEDIYVNAATQLGCALALEGLGLVFGAGAEGLMGALARGASAHGGVTIGVVPEMMNVDGVIYDGCTELFVTRTMRERKAMLEEKADAFIALPGGFGTFEELLEIITLKQLGYHQKPVAVLNVNGYYDALIAQFDTAAAQRFAAPEALTLYGVFGEIRETMEYIKTYRPETAYKKNMLFK